MTSSSSGQPAHLLVAQHGLWGNPSHLNRLVAHVRSSLEAGDSDVPVIILNSDCNVGNRTYDGVDACGSRLAELVLQRMQHERLKGREVVRISFLGYSLGGLICRYAVGKLYLSGVFKQVKPVNFITVATPHLGSFREPVSFWASFANKQVSLIASRTGHQLLLSDDDHHLPAAAKNSSCRRHHQQDPSATTNNSSSGSGNNHTGGHTSSSKVSSSQGSHIRAGPEALVVAGGTSKEQQEDGNHMQQHQQQQGDCTLSPGAAAAAADASYACYPTAAVADAQAAAEATDAAGGTNEVGSMTQPEAAAPSKKALALASPDHNEKQEQHQQQPQLGRQEAEDEQQQQQQPPSGKREADEQQQQQPQSEKQEAGTQQQQQQQQQQPQSGKQEAEEEQQQQQGSSGPIPVPLLVLMSCPGTPFYKGLALFPQRMICANVHHDPTVPYCTAAITLTNPFEGKRHVAIDPKYPSVVRVAAEGEEVPVVKYKGRSRLYVLLLLSPILLPLIPVFWIKMIVQGLLHHSKSRRRERDMSWWHAEEDKGAPGKAWLMTSSSSSSAAAAAAAAAVPAAGVAAAEGLADGVLASNGQGSSRSDGYDQQQGWSGRFGRLFCWKHASAEQLEEPTAAGRAGYATSTHDRQQEQQQHWQEDLGEEGSGLEDETLNPLPSSHQGEQLEAMTSSQLPDAIQEGLDMVSAHLSALHPSEAVHEGISTLPGPVKLQQEWMVGQLRALPGGWHQVDVCTGHYHAHAAIVVRDRRFESQRRDLFQYIVDHFVV